MNGEDRFRREPDHIPSERDVADERRDDPVESSPTGIRHPVSPPRGDHLWEDADERARRNPAAIRAEDTEPYLALQYVARLFKVAAMVVVVALVAEIVAGVALEGAGALLPLMAEVVRGTVLAAILWGAGDLTLLFIDVGHDVRAARVLLGRLSARAAAADAASTPSGERDFRERAPRP